jgi:hypothetical protein
MRVILVVFHMIGCPHCPPALDAARQCGVPMVAVESSHPLAQALDIKAFPTIILSTDQGAFAYGDRSRTPTGLAIFAREKAELLGMLDELQGPDSVL